MFRKSRQVFRFDYVLNRGSLLDDKAEWFPGVFETEVVSRWRWGFLAFRAFSEFQKMNWHKGEFKLVRVSKTIFLFGD